MNLHSIADALAVLTAEEHAVVLRLVAERVESVPRIVKFATPAEAFTHGASVPGIVNAIRNAIGGLSMAGAKQAFEDGRLATPLGEDAIRDFARRINAEWFKNYGTHETGDWRPASVVDVAAK